MEESTLAPGLWVKRDDLNALPLGGNKVRALEFLLGGLAPGEEVLTVGGIGSTHALATAIYAGRLGARTTVLRWPQVMNARAAEVDAKLRACAQVRDAGWIGAAYADALLRRAGPWLGGRPVRWIPAGGTTPLGILGHVEGALELAAQVAAGAVPAPARVVLPLGSGGTAAGLLLGLALAGIETEVIGVQVVPRLVASAGRVRRLAQRTLRFIEAASGKAIRDMQFGRFEVERGFYGGAYGREIAAGTSAALRFREAHGGAMLDPTYSAKACAAALARCAGGPTLFWVTFDSRSFDPAR